nr:MAG: ORF1 [Torque teno midi virus]
MAFWWQRRRRWYYRNNRKYKRRRTNRRRPRRRFWRRSYRRPTRRRRRRRRTKVKKKKQFLKLLQWQPDSIRKCKIIGIDILLLGYNGTQHRNYTTIMNYWTYPRTAGGGGFSTAVFSLQFLYEQYELRKNIWTFSNINYDLCRYTGSKFKFFRHPWASFIVTFQLMYPMKLAFPDYMATQPLQMLLTKKHLVIPSLKYKPKGKPYVKKYFKPPKQMVNKWFFQHSFSEKPLLLLKAAVCNLEQPFLGPMGENELVTLTVLNIYTAYQLGNWGKAFETYYMPSFTWTTPTTKYKKKGQQTQNTFTFQDKRIGYNGGWFSKDLLTAAGVQYNSTSQYFPPTHQIRYNPKQDDGIGNAVWLCSVTTDRYDKPSTDKFLIAREQPLWILLFGFTDFIIQLKHKTETEKIYYLLIETKYFRPQFVDQYLPNTYLVIDQTFINGQGPYGSTPTDSMITNWYPTIEHQQMSMSAIVTAGPFTYKPNTTQNNWELHYKYVFFFKWGGSQDTSKQVTDPSKHQDWVAPDNLQSAIQITDPKTQIPETILHTWDYRRDYITKTALKRMSEHFATDPLISTDTECLAPLKKPKFSTQLPHLQEEETKEVSCLQTLFETNTCQESQEEKEESLKQLINQQQQQQQQIKQNLLLLLTQLKAKQMELQLHSGLLE